MHLFYYLYIVVVVIPFKQIKVMKLKAYLLLQKLETQLVYLIDSLSNTETQTLLGTDLITTGTGTTGDTMTHFSGTVTTAGIPLEIGAGTIGLTLGTIMILLVGHLLDRKFNLNQDLDQELQKTQDQNNQENQNHE